MEFAYDGGGVGKGGDVALFVDGERVGEGRVDGTVPMLFSADETTDVGSDTATPVSDDYGVRDSEFTGTVRWDQIDLDAAAEDTDHLISPEERLRSRWRAVETARGAADAAPRNDGRGLAIDRSRRGGSVPRSPRRRARSRGSTRTGSTG